jgi:hypothetical protein
LTEIFQLTRIMMREINGAGKVGARQMSQREAACFTLLGQWRDFGIGPPWPLSAKAAVTADMF